MPNDGHEGIRGGKSPFGFFLSAAFLIQPFTDRIKGYNGYAIAEKAMIKALKKPKFISAVKEGKTKMAEKKKTQNEIVPAKENEEIVLALPEKERAAENAVLMEDIRLEEPAEQITRVNEIPELRGENRKVFRLSNGDEQAVFYCEPMHVFDESTDSFAEVDNALAEEADKRHYRSGRNRFVARFSREEENDELFSVEKGMCRVSVSAKKTAAGAGIARRRRFAGRTRPMCWCMKALSPARIWNIM